MGADGLGNGDHWITQHLNPPPCGPYGSSFLPTGPHTDGTCTNNVSLIQQIAHDG